ncbi:MAG: YfhO family protein [Caldilinea sp.]|nr:YfhO family protein [Caldilinea sp.]MDW8439712.1 YfhO family protein [Caldilineaceae bacterium]
MASVSHGKTSWMDDDFLLGGVGGEESMMRQARPAFFAFLARHAPPAALLAGFVLLLYGRLLFTNRVLAGGDIQLYFYAYWDYVGATLREGRIPFWNPYLFLGAPLLANPQAAVLYPLHWPLFAAGRDAFPVTKQLYWSAALHTWLLGLGAYALMRFWGYATAPALVSGLTLAGSGFVGGLIGHINQLNASTWLPWAALCLAWARSHASGAINWRVSLRAAAAFGSLTALMLLAGHTQSVFISLFALGVWTLWPHGIEHRGAEAPSVFPMPVFKQLSALRLYFCSVAPLLLVYFLGLLLAVLLAAPQLLPTLELSRLGLRSGGLTYAEATSFSLQPLALGWTLLPSYGLVDLGAAFDSPGYTEFVAYVGLLGLALALLAVWKGNGPARTFGLFLAGLGLFLALGRWNPVYFLLYHGVPGFNLFRAPARWMMVYTFGAAMLAGVGFAVLMQRRPKPATFLIGLMALELLLAARSLPHTHPTAPQAVYEVRTAPAHLLTDPTRLSSHPAAAPRFLGMSTITYDPGDMVDYRRAFLESDPPQLDARGFHELVIAQKVQELLAPNLPLFWRIPAVDGFDGGVLPLQRYIRFAELLVPPERLVPDGRLREQIETMPDSHLLAMLNVAYVITDKVRDLWFEDVFYDRQIGADLQKVEGALTIEAPLAFEATHVDLIGYVKGDAAALSGALHTVARLDVVARDGSVQRIALTAGDVAGAHFADAALNSPPATRSGAVVAYRDVEGERQEYRARLPLAAPTEVAALRIEAIPAPASLVVQAATLYDARTRMFTPLLPSDRGRFRLEHSGDVKVYRNLDTLPRAYLAGEMRTVDNFEDALAALRSDAGRVTVVEGSLDGAQPAGAQDRAEIIEYAPERVRVRTQSAQPALLVLSDSFYPGWSATVDGRATSIKAVNGLFRGVVAPAGTHEIVFTFEPTGWRPGVGLAIVGAALLAMLLGGSALARSSHR